MLEKQIQPIDFSKVKEPKEKWNFYTKLSLICNVITIFILAISLFNEL